MAKRSRTKGVQWEQEVARTLRDAFPGLADGIRRTAPLQAADGEAAPDVSFPGLWLECKCGARPRPGAALEQAIQAAPVGAIPVAVVRIDQKRPGEESLRFACLPLAAFVRLLAASTYVPADGAFYEEEDTE